MKLVKVWKNQRSLFFHQWLWLMRERAFARRSSAFRWDFRREVWVLRCDGGAWLRAMPPDDGQACYWLVVRI